MKTKQFFIHVKTVDYENLKSRPDLGLSPKSVELAFHLKFKKIYSHSD